MKKMRLNVLVLTIVFILPAVAPADVRLPGFMTDNMVLQRDMPVPIWGWADPGKKVKIKFGDQTKQAVADKNGRWMVKLDALKASAEGQKLTVESAAGDEKLTLKNVLVGEVWICSGQSNMEWAVSRVTNAKDEIAAAKHSSIRLLTIGHISKGVPQDNVKGHWQVCTPETVGRFSGVGYFFGRKIYKDKKVPVGLIGSNWGGTRIEPWTPPVGFRMVPELKKITEKIEDGKIGRSHQEPTKLYNGMIAPLVPYAIRGVIWYQGESNGREGMSYFHKMKALIYGWRKCWGQGDFPFYYVQLANFRKRNGNPAGGDGWARVREAQRKALELKNTGMAVTIDIGEAKDIHPKNKQDVGKRLALWALAKGYGMKDLVFSGPLYKSHKVEGDKIRITFEHVGSGLMVGKKEGVAPTRKVPDGELNGFAIAGKDRKWHWAEAKIDPKTNTVIVSSPQVKHPVAVRYGYRMNPCRCNLYNAEGLPASPFRTDHW